MKINKLNTDKIIIVKTSDKDLKDIIEVEKQAFGQDEEADLVKLLLKDKTAQPVLSLLAIYNNKAIGHILFTKAGVKEINNSPLMHILAPLAVIPDFQKQGIGGLLIKKGLEKLKEIGSTMVFVLGHMDYYPRHGFTPDAAKLGFTAPHPIEAKNANAWMVQGLTKNGIGDIKGTIKCSDVLNKPEYWVE